VNARQVPATAEAIEIPAFVRIPVISVDYRMAPDHPARAMDDVIAVWRDMTSPHTASATA
jgi:hypothetical protein